MGSYLEDGLQLVRVLLAHGDGRWRGHGGHVEVRVLVTLAGALAIFGAQTSEPPHTGEAEGGSTLPHKRSLNHLVPVSEPAFVQKFSSLRAKETEKVDVRK